MCEAQPNELMAGVHATGPRISPAELAHVFLLTRNLPRLRAWHLKVFDGQVTFETETLCLLGFDGKRHRIAIAALPQVGRRPDGMHVGPHHFAFAYARLDDLLHTYRRLKRERIEPYWTISHGITTSMFYQDPDGNRIELQVDNCANVQDLQAVMAGSFRGNPVGVIFDPETLARMPPAA